MNEKKIGTLLEKYLKKEYLLYFILIGILLFVIAIPMDSKKETSKEKTEPEDTKTLTQDIGTQEYRLSLQRELETFLGKMAGIGKVKVFLTLSEGEEAVVERDSQGTVYVEEQNKKVPFVKASRLPKVEGVLVLAQGADKGDNRTVLTTMLSGVFKIDNYKVQVAKME